MSMTESTTSPESTWLRTRHHRDVVGGKIFGGVRDQGISVFPQTSNCNTTWHYDKMLA